MLSYSPDAVIRQDPLKALYDAVDLRRLPLDWPDNLPETAPRCVGLSPADAQHRILVFVAGACRSIGDAVEGGNRTYPASLQAEFAHLTFVASYLMRAYRVACLPLTYDEFIDRVNTEYLATFDGGGVPVSCLFRGRLRSLHHLLRSVANCLEGDGASKPVIKKRKWYIGNALLDVLWFLVAMKRDIPELSAPREGRS